MSIWQLGRHPINRQMRIKLLMRVYYDRDADVGLIKKKRLLLLVMVARVMLMQQT